MDWDLGLTIYGVIGGVLVGGVLWALKKGGDYLAAKTHNETVGGVLARLTHSIGDAVAMVDQTLRREIEAAKDPSSDGGTTITKAEAAKMRAAVWDALAKEYGGFEGVLRLVKVIGIGDAAAARAKVDTMIESAVNTHGMRKAATSGPPTPAQ